MKIFIVSLFICSCLMTVVSIIYMALSSSLKNWSAKRRYNLWLIILLGFMTPIKPFVSDHLWKITLKTEEVSTAVNNIAPTNTAAVHSSFDLTKILFVVWLIGAIIFALKYLLTHYKFKSYLSKYSTPCDADISDLSETVAKELKIKKVGIVKLKGINSPMMIGLRQATIILPERKYSQSELRLIIKHELYHFKKRDLLYKAFLLVCKIIHWFNPIMPVIEREIESVCELACDERVIQNENKNDRKTYCHAILNSAAPEAEKENRLSPILSSNFVSDKNNLKHRLSLIIANTKKKRFTFISAVVILLTILSGTVFGVAYDNTDISYSQNGEMYETTTLYIPEEASTSITMVTDQNGNTMVTDQYGNFFEYWEDTTVLHLEETTIVPYSEQSFINTEPAQVPFEDSQTTNQYRTTTVTDRNS